MHWTGKRARAFRREPPPTAGAPLRKARLEAAVPLRNARLDRAAPLRKARLDRGGPLRTTLPGRIARRRPAEAESATIIEHPIEVW